MYKFCPHCGKQFLEPDEPRTIGVVTQTKGFLSWAQIKEWSDNNEAAQHFEIGDELHDTLLTGERVTLVVVEKDWPHEGAVVLQFKDCLADTYVMNAEATNKGGWEKTTLRKVLNNEIWNILPQDIRDCIKPIVRDGVKDWLWLPTEVQVFGEVCWGDEKDKTDRQQFAYYRRPGNRVKTLGEDGGRTSWWLASPSATNATNFCSVYDSGFSFGDNASYSVGVAPGFCI